MHPVSNTAHTHTHTHTQRLYSRLALWLSSSRVKFLVRHCCKMRNLKQDEWHSRQPNRTLQTNNMAGDTMATAALNQTKKHSGPCDSKCCSERLAHVHETNGGSKFKLVHIVQHTKVIARGHSLRKVRHTTKQFRF